MLSLPDNKDTLPYDFTNSLKARIDGVMSTFPAIDYRLIGASVFGPVSRCGRAEFRMLDLVV